MDEIWLRMGCRELRERLKYVREETYARQRQHRLGGGNEDGAADSASHVRDTLKKDKDQTLGKIGCNVWRELT